MNLIRNVSSSSFWRNDDREDKMRSLMSKSQADTYDLYKLAANKRAIANFVTILTNKRIPVRFIPRGTESYTDGERITISSKIDTPDDFDVACGLALHEASHILLSDFALLRNLNSTLVSKGVMNTPQYQYADENHLNPVYLIKTFLNVIEDRRIDDHIFKSAPGYRNYYRKMYEKYFFDRIITKALKTDEYTDETVRSYKFRIINLHVPETRLDALNGLQEVYDLINLHNISRLKNSHEALDIAIKVFYVVMDNVMGNTSTEDEEETDDIELFQTPSQGSDGTEPDDSEPGDESDETSDEEDEPDVDDPEDDEESDDEPENSQSSTTTDEDEDEDEAPELTERQKRIIDKRIEKQEDFVHNEVRKQKITTQDESTIEIIEETESEIKTIGKDTEFQETFRGSKDVPVVLVKNMTETLVESRSFPLYAGSHTRGKLELAVEEGMKLGRVLAKKLQVRAESRDTIYNKQKTGKLDKRMLASLGYGQSNVFYRKDVDQYNDVNLHMSIDASGSMHRMWSDVMTNAVALAKACSIIPNLEIQISFRTNTDNPGRGRKTMPYVLIAYDSRKDPFTKVAKLFHKIDCGNLTPEGLCFEAIENFIVDSNKDIDSIFLNLSDGAPNYSNDRIRYSGRAAASHTLKQVKKMKRRGIKVISYFIEDNYYDSDHSIFDASYGSDARYIDVTNVHEVSKTMNKVFLEK